MLGLASFPLTAAAAIAIAFGASVEMCLALLLFAESAWGRSPSPSRPAQLTAFAVLTAPSWVKVGS